MMEPLDHTCLIWARCRCRTISSSVPWRLCAGAHAGVGGLYSLATNGLTSAAGNHRTRDPAQAPRAGRPERGGAGARCRWSRWHGTRTCPHQTAWRWKGAACGRRCCRRLWPPKRHKTSLTLPFFKQKISYWQQLTHPLRKTHTYFSSTAGHLLRGNNLHRNVDKALPADGASMLLQSMRDSSFLSMFPISLFAFDCICVFDCTFDTNECVACDAGECESVCIEAQRFFFWALTWIMYGAERDVEIWFMCLEAPRGARVSPSWERVNLLFSCLQMLITNYPFVSLLGDFCLR